MKGIGSLGGMVRLEFIGRWVSLYVWLGKWVVGGGEDRGEY